MILNHTPDPWTDDCATFYVHGANGHAVACCLVHDDTPASYNEALANLRLVTEAPAMLEALQYWLPKSLPLEGIFADPIVANHHAKWHEARAILARLGNEVIQ